jgi:hypothetical protein
MELAIQVGALLLWLPLNLLIIAALLRGEYRRFYFIFAYTVVEFLATAAEIPAYWAVYTHGHQAETLQVFVYWTDETIAQVLIFAVVISLIHKATAQLTNRRVLRMVLVVGAFLFAGVSFLVHFTPSVKPGLWMTPWTRDLNFCAALLDLVLWALLIASREKDRRLLLLSGALGIQFTGEAIGEAVRQLAIQHRSHPVALLGSTLVVTADILRSYIWWRVFYKSPAANPAPMPARITAD